MKLTLIPLIAATLISGNLFADCLRDMNNANKYTEKAKNAKYASSKAQLYRYAADYFIEAKYSCDQQAMIDNAFYIDDVIENRQEAARYWESK